MTEATSLISKLRSALPFLPKAAPVVTVIDLVGAIAPSGRARGISYAKVRPVIEDAFKPSNLKGVALAINSPGGSPVQSRLIFHAIRRAAERKKVPVLAFIEDVGASGGYILAAAGDEIIADESSVVGSIGVISATFGFVSAIDRLGVERRVKTAGDNKSQLDPFMPEDPDDVARLQEILNDLHEQFIALVKSRRGDALNTDFDDIFTGAFWTAPRAKERGLVDAMGRLDEYVKTRFGEKIKIKRVTPRTSPLVRALGGARGVGAAAADDVASAARVGPFLDAEGALAALEDRAEWGRFGLTR
ncbi:MAG: S49 family peptidase [Pseudomonadota bacterium]